MRETPGRLLRLLSLMQNRNDWSGAELAERLGVTTRTVRRDIERLRALGYPVETTPGTAGYRLGVGAALPPLLLDDEEAVAVAIGLRTAAMGTVTGIEEASVRALAKLERFLPSRLRHRISALGDAMVPMTGGAAVDPGVLTTIARACQGRYRLRFDYQAADGGVSVRDAEPYRLVHSGRRWYLLAFDVDRDDWRTFRVDRIRPRAPDGPRFTPRPLPEPDAAGYTSLGITTRPYRYQARVTFHASAAEVSAVLPPTVARVEPDGPHRCTVRAGADSLDVLALHLGAVGVEFTVHEPPELVAHLDRLAGRLLRARPGVRRRPRE